MLLTGIWHGGLSDESVEDMANANLHVMRFLGLSLEDDVPDFGTVSFQDTINQQIQEHDIMVTQGCHVDASITHSLRKPKTRPSYEVVANREDRDDEEDAKAAMRY